MHIIVIHFAGCTGIFLLNERKMRMNTISQKARSRISTKELVIISLLSGLSYVLMLIHLPFKYLGFLEIEFSDIPAVFAALQYGPLAGVFVELIKNLIKAATATTTGWVGEIANFIISAAYVIPVGILYKIRKSNAANNAAVLEAGHGNEKSKSGAWYIIMMFAVGTASLATAGILLNYYVTVPLFAKLFGGMDTVVGAASGHLSVIKDIKTLVLLGITPFNILKGAAISVIGYYTYKYLRNRI
jgi:riboflavin transporter FmnP